MEPDTFYSTSAVSALTGLTLRQLDWWDTEQVLSPVKSGRRRLYSPDDVMRALLAAELMKKGLSFHYVRAALTPLAKIHRVGYLAVVGDTGAPVIYSRHAKGLVSTLCAKYAPFYLVDLADLASVLSHMGQRKTA
jgi:hypothetical protein